MQGLNQMQINVEFIFHIVQDVVVRLGSNFRDMNSTPCPMDAEKAID